MVRQGGLSFLIIIQLDFRIDDLLSSESCVLRKLHLCYEIASNQKAHMRMFDGKQLVWKLAILLQSK